MLLEIFIAGNVMIGPNLCQVDFIHNGQLYTVEYKCLDNKILSRKRIGPDKFTTF
jgi:hypothetical protein